MRSTQQAAGESEVSPKSREDLIGFMSESRVDVMLQHIIAHLYSFVKRIFKFSCKFFSNIIYTIC